jgi:hypothetical protein
MKRAVAIILSLTVIWLQLVAAAQTLSAAAAVNVPTADCDCCVGQTTCRCCCVAPSAPNPAPQPVTPLRPLAAGDFTAIISPRVAWLLPAPVAAQVSASDLSPASLSAVPLFRRDCALLI